MRWLGLLVCAGLLPAAAAWAQPAPRSIDDLLTQSPDPDEPDTAGQPPAGREPQPVIIPPRAAIPYAPPPRPQLTEPVRIEETGKSPDAPPSLRDLAYDSRLKSSFASAQGFQGPLEGAWVLTAAGVGLYALQLVDRADRLEGAWRDLRRRGAISGSGLLDVIQRSGNELTVRFTGAGGATSSASLRGTADGAWFGQLIEDGASQAVVLRRPWS